ncbi:MAG: NAD(P)/FAD-dependent oxidoreductase [Calditrichaeota bacterium]|nr:MAG: NAD(P)/FAD-dependent oxidoreductase [Calditrichota bacterium]MBL1206487.1 NAD(P)/FAD-dependent oxidoreductase [Calditrichota bacterium]NOG46314.1 NAD(P)/FAD-dependent oxidoreductase [Calditrichota bacterium]
MCKILMNNFDLIVVGAGPAGLLSAGRAAELGAKVLVLEKMRSEGRKLLITGKGRCNITNNKPITEFIKHVYPKGRFLRNAFSHFYSDDIMALLHRYGVESSLSRGGRYFPTSNKAADVLEALLKWVNELKVEIRCGEKVEKLLVENNIVRGVQANGKNLMAEKIIIATGGKSYPATGSNGDGYELARRVGHSIVKARPALVPLETEGGIAQKLQGLNLKNVRASVWVENKKIAEEFGEMIFTHFGLSGPIILTLSRTVVDELQKKNRVDVSIDLKPALDEQKLDRRLQRDLNEHGKKKIGNIFSFWLPSKMIPVFIELLGIDSEKECHQISGKERKQIRHLLKNLPFKISHHRSFKEAIITAGGIPTSEISQKTMESKIIKNLYFAGEMIDVDAKTGGYNLQIAYSTGWLAGHSSITK